jgi:hypothetical protein
VRTRSILGALGAGVLVASFGCGGNADKGTGAAGEVGVFDPDGGQGPDADVGRLVVSASSSSPSLCAGDCATLSAEAAGGVAPYAFAWDHGLTSTGATALVCPDETTTYTVTATDSSGHTSGELQTPSQTGTASVTLTVDASCAGHPPADDAGADGGSDDATPDDDATGIDSTGACVNAGNAPWSGCETIESGGPGTSAIVGWCTEPGSTTVPYSYGLCLPRPMLAGQMYSVQMTFNVSGVVGPAPQDSLVGSTQLCAESQTLVPLQTWPFIFTPYTGSFTQSACVTADANYPVLLMEMLQQNGSGIPSDMVAIEICNGCGGS